MYRYCTEGVCSTEIFFDIEGGYVKNVSFTDGCTGNLQAVSVLVEGMSVSEVIDKLKGITCRNGTSCADQLAKALEAASKEAQAG
jgi:uncharacterized protein (TIGR03905 family)